ncbi:MAG: hypothetical protein Q8Q18_01070 [bacterium]|nr:hypothetical protein [bacterium]
MRVLVGCEEGYTRKARLALTSAVDIVRVIDADGFVAEDFLQELMSVGMFGETRGVVCSRVLADKIKGPRLLSALKELPKDASVLILEDEIEKEVLKELTEQGIDVVVAPKKKEVFFNPFALTDAVASGNKKSAWVAWHKARAAGQPAEYLLTMVSWQLRNMLIASHIPQFESEMKPFVFEKAKKAASRYSYKKLEALAQESVDIQVRARTHVRSSLDSMAEQLLLSL